MNFAQINHIDDLKDLMKDHPEFGIVKQQNGYQVVSYFIAGDESFDSMIARECRGITFDRDGKIVCRPLHKFFNVGERQETQINILPWDKVVRVMDKRDGSMINTCIVDGKVLVKTKRSFTSDVAIVAQKWFDAHPEYLEFAEDAFILGFTPTFEYTSPSNRIVLSYQQEEMTLLHVRNMVTGEYMSQFQLETLCDLYGMTLVDSFTVQNISEFLSKAKDTSGIEGWVIQFEDGEMVKLKTEEYLKHHRTITFVRERDIAEMVLDEMIDDVKSSFIERGMSLDKIHVIEHQVMEILHGLQVEVEGFYEEFRNLERKEFAQIAMKFKTFGLMMQMYVGKEPDYVKYFKAHILKEHFGLTTI